MLNDADIKLLRGLVNQKIKIYWPLDKVWYVADVLHFDEQTNKLKILYVEDQLEEEVELWTERSQQYIPPTDLSHRDLHGITPLRVPVEIGGVEGFLEVGARRNEEYIVFKPPTTSGKKRKRLDTDSKKTKWHAMKPVLKENSTSFYRPTRSVDGVKTSRTILEDGKTARSIFPLQNSSANTETKMPLLKWLITQGDKWAASLSVKLRVGFELPSEVSLCSNGYAVFEEEEGEEEEGEEEEEGAVKEATKSTTIGCCKSPIQRPIGRTFGVPD